MKQSKLTLLGLSLAAAGAVTFTSMRAASGQAVHTTTNVHQTPVRLIHAQPFALDEAYAYSMHAEVGRPMVQSGWIVAIATDPEIAFQNQVHDELLFVGRYPVERLNNGDESGVVIGFVPSALDAAGEPVLDLAETPIYWAKPEILPESMTTPQARETLTAAIRDGAAPQTEQALAAARTAGVGTVYVANQDALMRFCADLVAQHSPQETDLIGSLRLEPLIK